MNEGDSFYVLIERVGSKGDGIGRHEGFLVFVPETKVGDRVKVIVEKIIDNKIFAKKYDEVFDPQPELDSEDF